MLFDISKIFNEAKIDLKGVNVRINKQGKATVTMQFGIRSKDQLAWITAKLNEKNMRWRYRYQKGPEDKEEICRI